MTRLNSRRDQESPIVAAVADEEDITVAFRDKDGKYIKIVVNSRGEYCKGEISEKQYMQIANTSSFFDPIMHDCRYAYAGKKRISAKQMKSQER